jgi:hypothetical protein
MLLLLDTYVTTDTKKWALGVHLNYDVDVLGWSRTKIMLNAKYTLKTFFFFSLLFFEEKE